MLGAHFVGELARRGHELTVLTGRDVMDLPPRGEVEGVPVVRVPFRAPLERRDPAALAALLEEVVETKRRVAADVVHLYHLGPDALIHELTRRASPAPDVATLHGPFPPNLLTPTAPVGRALRRCETVVGCSVAALQDFLDHVPEATPRGRAIPNALPADLRPVVPPPDRPTILMLGRVVPQKGFDLGVEAFAQVLDERPDARLVVAGDGVELEAVQRLAVERGVAHAVEFLGWVARADVPGLIEAATLVLMPSRYEGFGLVTIETGRCARPVVAFAIAGMPEAVVHDETGLLVEPEDVDGLAGAVRALLADPARAASLGAEARRRAGNAAWEAHVGAYEEVYAAAVTAAASARS
ncbi:MAG: glycosyltransferase family 4 protein [Thermoleophilia bacterium]